ncbi:MAG: TIGR03560 family F420-dependent LLM class oxidoreductase [Anaerolineae bacterium]
MKVNIQVEGQRGLNWPRWQRLGLAVEQLGFAGLFRSDHFLDAEPPDQDSLELWVSLAWLADHTRRIQFGPLVSPVSFRHPVHTARIAKDVDDLSGGRLVLGLGAGWGGGVREHEAFGFDLLDTASRFKRFTEALEIITALLRSDVPVTFAGEYYRLQEATLLPRPQRPNGPPILIGGNGPNLVLSLAARYADEWNGIYRTPAQFAQLNRRLDELLLENGRQPGEVRRSQMKGLVFGRNDTELRQGLAGRDPAGLLERGLIVGTPAAVVDQLGQLAQAGMQGVMLQWADLDDEAGLEAFAQTVLPQVQR